MRPAVIAIATIAAIGAAVATSRASPMKELEEARRSFRAKDWQSAAKGLNFLLYPPPPKLADPSDLADAHTLLGLSHYELGNRDDAKNEIEAALAIDPTKTLEAPFYTTGQIKIFDEVRGDLDARRKRDEELRKIQDEKEALRAYKESIRLYEQHNWWLNLAPLGLGQFQNGHRTKGYLVLGGELVTGGATLGIVFYLGSKYGYPNGKVPVDEIPTTNALQITAYTTGIAFVLIYGYSVFDALRHYKAQRIFKADDSQLKDIKLPDKPAKKPAPSRTSWRDRLHFGPVLVPGGAGIGVALEND